MNLDDDNIAYSCHFLAKLHRNPFLGELSGAENRNAKALGMTDRQTPKGQQQNSQNLLNLVDEIFRFVNLDRLKLNGLPQSELGIAGDLTQTPLA
jgi:hypothetical protein